MNATGKINVFELRYKRRIPSLTMRKEPLEQPHASSQTNTFITVYGFLGPLANPPGSFGGAVIRKEEGLGLLRGPHQRVRVWEAAHLESRC